VKTGCLFFSRVAGRYNEVPRRKQRGIKKLSDSSPLTCILSLRRLSQKGVWGKRRLQVFIGDKNNITS